MSLIHCTKVLFITSWYFYNHKAQIEMVFWKQECSLIKRDYFKAPSLTQKPHSTLSRQWRHPFSSHRLQLLLPLETASSHSSSLAAVTLKETPNQNICLSFSLCSDRWMRADTRGRRICPNQGLISVSPSGECFISTGHWWIRHLALIWRSGSPPPKCQVKSRRQGLSHHHYRQHSKTTFTLNSDKCCRIDPFLVYYQESCDHSDVLLVTVIINNVVVTIMKW